MSVKAWEKYQPNASSPSPQYPYGSLRQETALGMGDGTPLDVEWGNDFEAFKQTAFSRSGLVPSGNTDTVTNSEMFNAMQDSTTRVLWERSAAESGYNLVAGSFEEGGTLVNANDVLWSKKLNKIFSGTAGTVAAGTNPASGGFVDVSNKVSDYKVIHDVSGFNVSNPLFGDKIKLISYHKPAIAGEMPYTKSGGDFVYYDLPRTMHNGGTVISPTVPCVTPFTYASLIDFLKGVGETNASARGVWLRIGDDLNMSCFGADPTGSLYFDKVFQHMVDTLYTTSNGFTGSGVTIPVSPGLYKQELPIVFDKDYIKVIASGKDETVFWKPGAAVRTDLGTNTAPLRDDVGGVTDSYNVDAMVIYTHPDNGFRFGSQIHGVRMSGKSEDPAQSLTSYRPYGIYAPRSAMCSHTGISGTRIAKLYFTFDTFKHTAKDLTTNFGGGVFFYEKDSSGKIASGTSLSAENCWASRPLTEAGLFLAAYDLEGLEYSTLTACSADNMFEPWRLKRCHLDISSGSTELARSVAGMTIDGGNVKFTNWRSVAPTSTLQIQIDIKGGAKVKFSGGKLSNKVAPVAGDYGVRVTGGAEVTFDQFEFPTNGTPYLFDFTSATPAKSVALYDEFGVAKLFNSQTPDGVYNVPSRVVSINDLNNKALTINTRHKYAGRHVIITGTNRSAYATGSLDTSTWVDSSGTVVATPA